MIIINTEEQFDFFNDVDLEKLFQETIRNKSNIYMNSKRTEITNTPSIEVFEIFNYLEFMNRDFKNGISVKEFKEYISELITEYNLKIFDGLYLNFLELKEHKITINDIIDSNSKLDTEVYQSFIDSYSKYGIENVLPDSNVLRKYFEDILVIMMQTSNFYEFYKNLYKNDIIIDEDLLKDVDLLRLMNKSNNIHYDYFSLLIESSEYFIKEFFRNIDEILKFNNKISNSRLFYSEVFAIAIDHNAVKFNFEDNDLKNTYNYYAYSRKDHRLRANYTSVYNDQTDEVLVSHYKEPETIIIKKGTSILKILQLKKRFKSKIVKYDPDKIDELLQIQDQRERMFFNDHIELE